MESDSIKLSQRLDSAPAPTTIETQGPDQSAKLQPEDYASSEEEVADTRTPLEKQYPPTPRSLPRRIHILGTGSIGKLVAHSLRSLPQPPPVTLIFHRFTLLKAWEEGKQQVTIRDDGHDIVREGFEVELMPDKKRVHGVEVQGGKEAVYEFSERSGVAPHEAVRALKEQQEDEAEGAAPEEEDINDALGYGQPTKKSTPRQEKPNPAAYAISSDPIHNLILTTKAAFSIPALSAIKHRLLPTSTICFLQNGMGIIDEVNKTLFPNPADRPNYMQGIITHGANVPAGTTDPFFAVHAGHGTIALGILPRDDPHPSAPSASTEDETKPSSKPLQTWAPSSRYLMRTLTRSPILCAVGFAPAEMLQQQLEKLVMNCVINPLTSLIDSRNGSLNYNFAFTRTMRLMLAEISAVILRLPELQHIPNVPNRFSTARLETLVVAMANRSKDNVSSMLADVRAGQRTEIEYINGYVVKRGEEVGISCVVNYAIMQLVIGKQQVVEREFRGSVPLEGQARKGGGG